MAQTDMSASLPSSFGPGLFSNTEGLDGQLSRVKGKKKKREKPNQMAVTVRPNTSTEGEGVEGAPIAIQSAWGTPGVPNKFARGRSNRLFLHENGTSPEMVDDESSVGDGLFVDTRKPFVGPSPAFGSSGLGNINHDGNRGTLRSAGSARLKPIEGGMLSEPNTAEGMSTPPIIDDLFNSLDQQNDGQQYKNQTLMEKNFLAPLDMTTSFSTYYDNLGGAQASPNNNVVGGTTVIGQKLPATPTLEKVDIYISGSHGEVKGPIGTIPHSKDCNLLQLRNMIVGSGSNSKTSQTNNGSGNNNKHMNKKHSRPNTSVVESYKYCPRTSSAGVLITNNYQTSSSTPQNGAPRNRQNGGSAGNGGSILVDAALLPPRWCFAYADGVRVAPAQEDRLRVSLFGGAVLIAEKASKPVGGLGRLDHGPGGFMLEPPPLTEPSASYPLVAPLDHAAGSSHRNKKAGGGGDKKRKKKSNKLKPTSGASKQPRSRSPSQNQHHTQLSSLDHLSKGQNIDSNEYVGNSRKQQQPSSIQKVSKDKSRQPVKAQQQMISNSSSSPPLDKSLIPEAILLNPLYGAEQYTGQKDKALKKEKRAKRKQISKSKSVERQKAQIDGKSGEIFNEVVHHLEAYASLAALKIQNVARHWLERKRNEAFYRAIEEAEAKAKQDAIDAEIEAKALKRSELKTTKQYMEKVLKDVILMESNDLSLLVINELKLEAAEKLADELVKEDTIQESLNDVMKNVMDDEMNEMAEQCMYDIEVEVAEQLADEAAMQDAIDEVFEEALGAAISDQALEVADIAMVEVGVEMAEQNRIEQEILEEQALIEQEKLNEEARIEQELIEQEGLEDEEEEVRLEQDSLEEQPRVEQEGLEDEEEEEARLEALSMKMDEEAAIETSNIGVVVDDLIDETLTEDASMLNDLATDLITQEKEAEQMRIEAELKTPEGKKRLQEEKKKQEAEEKAALKKAKEEEKALKKAETDEKKKMAEEEKALKKLEADEKKQVEAEEKAALIMKKEEEKALKKLEADEKKKVEAEEKAALKKLKAEEKAALKKAKKEEKALKKLEAKTLKEEKKKEAAAEKARKKEEQAKAKEMQKLIKAQEVAAKRAAKEHAHMKYESAKAVADSYDISTPEGAKATELANKVLIVFQKKEQEEKADAITLIQNVARRIIAKRKCQDAEHLEHEHEKNVGESTLISFYEMVPENHDHIRELNKAEDELSRANDEVIKARNLRSEKVSDSLLRIERMKSAIKKLKLIQTINTPKTENEDENEVNHEDENASQVTESSLRSKEDEEANEFLKNMFKEELLQAQEIVHAESSSSIDNDIDDDDAVESSLADEVVTHDLVHAEEVLASAEREAFAQAAVLTSELLLKEAKAQAAIVEREMFVKAVHREQVERVRMESILEDDEEDEEEEEENEEVKLEHSHEDSEALAMAHAEEEAKELEELKREKETARQLAAQETEMMKEKERLKLLEKKLKAMQQRLTPIEEDEDEEEEEEEESEDGGVQKQEEEQGVEQDQQQGEDQEEGKEGLDQQDGEEQQVLSIKDGDEDSQGGGASFDAFQHQKLHPPNVSQQDEMEPPITLNQFLDNGLEEWERKLMGFDEEQPAQGDSQGEDPDKAQQVISQEGVQDDDSTVQSVDESLSIDDKEENLGSIARKGDVDDEMYSVDQIVKTLPEPLLPVIPQQSTLEVVSKEETEFIDRYGLNHTKSMRLGDATQPSEQFEDNISEITLEAGGTTPMMSSRRPSTLQTESDTFVYEDSDEDNSIVFHDPPIRPQPDLGEFTSINGANGNEKELTLLNTSGVEDGGISTSKLDTLSDDVTIQPLLDPFSEIESTKQKKIEEEEKEKLRLLQEEEEEEEAKAKAIQEAEDEEDDADSVASEEDEDMEDQKPWKRPRPSSPLEFDSTILPQEPQLSAAPAPIIYDPEMHPGRMSTPSTPGNPNIGSLPLSEFGFYDGGGSGNRTGLTDNDENIVKLKQLDMINQPLPETILKETNMMITEKMIDQSPRDSKNNNTNLIQARQLEEKLLNEENLLLKQIQLSSAQAAKVEYAKQLKDKTDVTIEKAREQISSVCRISQQCDVEFKAKKTLSNVSELMDKKSDIMYKAKLLASSSNSVELCNLAYKGNGLKANIMALKTITTSANTLSDVTYRNALLALRSEQHEELFDSASLLRSKAKKLLNQSNHIISKQKLASYGEDTIARVTTIALNANSVEKQKDKISQGQRISELVSNNAIKALNVDNSLALVELAGRGICSQVLTNAETAGRIELTKKPLYGQVNQLLNVNIDNAMKSNRINNTQKPIVKSMTDMNKSIDSIAKQKVRIDNEKRLVSLASNLSTEALNVSRSQTRLTDKAMMQESAHKLSVATNDAGSRRSRIVDKSMMNDSAQKLSNQALDASGSQVRLVNKSMMNESAQKLSNQALDASGSQARLVNKTDISDSAQKLSNQALLVSNRQTRLTDKAMIEESARALNNIINGAAEMGGITPFKTLMDIHDAKELYIESHNVTGEITSINDEESSNFLERYHINDGGDGISSSLSNSNSESIIDDQIPVEGGSGVGEVNNLMNHSRTLTNDRSTKTTFGHIGVKYALLDEASIVSSVASDSASSALRIKDKKELLQQTLKDMEKQKQEAEAELEAQKVLEAAQAEAQKGSTPRSSFVRDQASEDFMARYGSMTENDDDSSTSSSVRTREAPRESTPLEFDISAQPVRVWLSPPRAMGVKPDEIDPISNNGLPNYDSDLSEPPTPHLLPSSREDMNATQDSKIEPISLNVRTSFMEGGGHSRQMNELSENVTLMDDAVTPNHLPTSSVDEELQNEAGILQKPKTTEENDVASNPLPLPADVLSDNTMPSEATSPDSIPSTPPLPFFVEEWTENSPSQVANLWVAGENNDQTNEDDEEESAPGVTSNEDQVNAVPAPQISQVDRIEERVNSIDDSMSTSVTSTPTLLPSESLPSPPPLDLLSSDQIINEQFKQSHPSNMDQNNDNLCVNEHLSQAEDEQELAAHGSSKVSTCDDMGAQPAIQPIPQDQSGVYVDIEEEDGSSPSEASSSLSPITNTVITPPSSSIEGYSEDNGTYDDDNSIDSYERGPAQMGHSDVVDHELNPLASLDGMNSQQQQLQNRQANQPDQLETAPLPIYLTDVDEKKLNPINNTMNNNNAKEPSFNNKHESLKDLDEDELSIDSTSSIDSHVMIPHQGHADLTDQTMNGPTLVGDEDLLLNSNNNVLNKGGKNAMPSPQDTLDGSEPIISRQQPSEDLYSNERNSEKSNAEGGLLSPLSNGESSSLYSVDNTQPLNNIADEDLFLSSHQKTSQVVNPDSQDIDLVRPPSRDHSQVLLDSRTLDGDISEAVNRARNMLTMKDATGEQKETSPAMFPDNISPSLLWRGGVVQPSTGRVFMVAVSSLPTTTPVAVDELNKTTEEAIAVESDNSDDDDSNDGDFTPRPVPLGEADEAPVEINDQDGALIEDSATEQSTENDDQHPVIVVHLVDTDSGNADGVGLTVADLQKYELTELTMIGNETPRRQHGLASRLLEVLGKHDTSGVGAGPQDSVEEKETTPQEIISHEKDEEATFAAEVIAKAKVLNFAAGSPALSLGPLPSSSSSSSSSSGSVVPVGGQTLWLRGVKLPIATVYIQKDDNNDQNQTNTSKLVRSIPKDTRNDIMFSGHKMGSLVTMKLMNETEVYIEVVNPASKSMKHSLTLQAAHVQPWIKRTLGFDYDGDEGDDDDGADFEAQGVLFKYSNEVAEEYELTRKFTSLTAPQRRSLCAWIEGLLFFEISPNSSTSSSEEETIDLTDIDVMFSDKSSLELSNHPLLRLPESFNSSTNSMNRKDSNNKLDSEIEKQMIFENVGIRIPILLSDDLKNGEDNYQNINNNEPTFKITATRNDDNDLFFNIENENKEPPSSQKSQTFEVLVSFNDWVHLLYGNLEELTNQQIDSLVHSIIQCFIIKKDRFDKSHLLLNISKNTSDIMMNSMNLDHMNDEGRTPIHIVLEFIANETTSSATSSPKMKQNKEQEEGGEKGEEENKIEEDDSRQIHVIVKVRQGSDELWVIATNVSTDEVYHARLTGDKWRLWFKDDKLIDETTQSKIMAPLPVAPLGGNEDSESSSSSYVSLSNSQLTVLQSSICQTLRIIPSINLDEVD